MKRTYLGNFSISTKRMNKNTGKGDKRTLITNFNSDLLRVTSSPAFRRLQDKTQLFPLEKNDYARTRLTHSIEVASVGRALSQSVSKKLEEKYNKNTMAIIQSVLPICCYLHDIGNPPFGHYGEEVIRQFFRNNWENIECCECIGKDNVKLQDVLKIDSQEYRDFVNFDGNAQALRVITNIEPLYDGEYGLNLTAAVIGGLIKYPYSSIDSKIPKDSKNYKFGYFKSEENVIQFLTEAETYKEHRIYPIALLMEACDDIAMFVSDFEDSVKKGCISYSDITKACKGKRNLSDFKSDLESKHKTKENSEIILDATSEALRPILYDTKTKLIQDVAQTFVDNFEKIANCEGHKYFRSVNNDKTLIEDAEDYRLIKVYKELMKTKVYSNRNILLPELKGAQILNTLLDRFTRAICSLSFEDIICDKCNKKEFKLIKLLSKNFLQIYKDYILKLKAADEYTFDKDIYARLHLVVDEISGMTDSYAVNLYNDLMR